MATQENTKVVSPLRQYETLLIAEPGFEKEQIDELVSKYDAQIQKFGGRLVRTTEWGKRRLAYEIKKHQEGHYVLIEFEGRGDLVKKCDNYLNLQSSVLRHMTLKKGE